jgi:hypothetical protein
VDISTLDKDALAAHAKETHGVELDKSKRIDTLRNEVKKLAEAQADASDGSEESIQVQASESADSVNPEGVDESATPITSGKRYLKNRATGAVFTETPRLKARGDLIPCDKDGNPV